MCKRFRNAIDLIEEKYSFLNAAAFHQIIRRCNDLAHRTLPHLDRSETEQYIKSHMDYSGCTQDIFTSKAIDEVHKASAGTPRIINRICEKTLMYAYQQQKRLIDDYMIRFVVEHELLNLGTN